MTDTPELNVWREACYVENETFHAVNGTFENDPEACQASAFAQKAAVAVIRTYGDERYQAAIDDVVAWLASELPYDVVSGMVARRFGRDA